MKFTCATHDLLTALQLVSRAISSQQALPILGNILFKVESGTCTVSATDLELSIVTSFDATVETEGSITIPSKAILNFAQYNADPEVTLETIEGTQLKCTSAHGKTMLSGEKASDYPSIPTVENKTSFALDAASLLEALHLVTFTSARTSLRPVLSGVYLRTEGEHFILVATDSYRLSEYKIKAQAEGEGLTCIIPVKVLDELRSMLAGLKPAKRTATEDDAKEGTREEAMPVHVTLSTQQIEMKVGKTRLLSRLIEGKFPDYRQIIPKEAPTKTFMSTRELSTATKRMHYFAKEVNNSLTFSIKPLEVHMQTPQTQLGRDEATLPAETTGADGKIALSSSYLLDFLAHIDGEQVEMRVMDSMHPAVFHLPGNDKFLHLIMPLRLQES